MNFIYPSAKDLMMTGQLDLLGDPIICVLVNGNYVASYHHTTLADIPAATRVGFSGTLVSKTVANGVFGAANALAENVYGDTIQAVVLIKQTGSETAPLLVHLDQSAFFPLNFGGGQLSFTWEPTSYKVFAI